MTRNPKSEILPGFCQISGDWGESGIPNLAQISLIKSYQILQNASVATFTISELLRENQKKGGGGKITSPPPRLGLNALSKKYPQWQILHCFDALLLLISVPSETSILS